jgi:hypothetical protein
VKLDDWTNEQVDILIDRGGNAAVNTKYEAYLPENYGKPNPDSSSDERTDFIKYIKIFCSFLLSPVLLFCSFNFRANVGPWKQAEQEVKAIKSN